MAARYVLKNLCLVPGLLQGTNPFPWRSDSFWRKMQPGQEGRLFVNPACNYGNAKERTPLGRAFIV